MTTQKSHNNKTPATEQIQQQLDRILASQLFVEAPRLGAFLQYIVEETLEGRAGRLKGITIAIDVFDRSDLEDAQTSTVVRVEAGRLRRRLSDYYSSAGMDDPVRIDIPKGAYVPTFELIEGAIEDEKPEHQISQRTESFQYIPQIIAVFALLVVIILLAWLYLSNNSQQAATDSSISTRPSIAVLPFENVSDDPRAYKLANGITEDIITDLTSLAGIDVIAYNSVMPFRQSAVDIKTIASQLHVSHILRGSIRGTNSSIRVTAQFYEAGSGNQVWAKRFDRELDDTLSLQDELATNIVDGIALGLHGEEWKLQRESKTENREARALYNQAMHIANPPSDPGRLQVALRAFERLVEDKPDYAGGYAGAAYIHAFYAMWGHSKSPDIDLKEAKALAETAISLDPSSGIAHSALAFTYLTQRDFKQAIFWSEKAIKAQPGDPYVMVYHAAILNFNGQATESIEFAERALRLDPLYPRTPYLNILGMSQFHAGNLEAAIESLQRSLDRGGPDNPGIQKYRAATLALLGRTGEARTVLKLSKLYGSKFNFENWLKQSFRNPQDADKVLNALRDLKNN
jgi:TolB-like protein/cytochrome c-type biogenesis protein CcmH/NrfG